MSLTQMTDEALVSSFQETLIEERENLVAQLEHIVELDRRKLFFHYSSLYSFLVQEKGMEEWQAERKIRIARLLGRFPEIKGQLESGKLNLTLLELGLGLGCAHREKLSDPEFWELLESLSGMSCQRARREIARRFPHSVDVSRDRIRPISEELSEVRFVANQELLDKLEEIRGLLAHSHPGASLAEVIDVLATEYRERHHPEEKAKRAEKRSQKKSESVETPAATRVQFVERRAPSASQNHALIRRDGYHCTYVDALSGLRCTSTFALETHHCREWALGGRTELTNLRLLCRNHHRRLTFQAFGR